MNKKVREDLLSIDILSFPQPELYKYGPMDKDIPQYAKLPKYVELEIVSQASLAAN